MIIYGILTGIVFNEVMKVNYSPPADMDGKMIGTLLFRDYDDAMVRICGGRSVRNNDSHSSADQYMDYHHLLKKLEKKEIDGVAIDMFTMMYILWTSWHLQTQDVNLTRVNYNESFRKSLKDRIEYAARLISVRKSPKTPEVYTYGTLVKSREDYAYLKSATEGMRETIKEFWDNDYYQLAYHGKKGLDLALYSAKNELYSYSGQYFQNTMMAVAVMVVLICVFGVVYELFRAGTCSRQKERCDDL